MNNISAILNLDTTFLFAKNTELVSASYNRQISGDSKVKNYNFQFSFVSPMGPKAWVNKTGFDIIFFILLFIENCL